MHGRIEGRRGWGVGGCIGVARFITGCWSFSLKSMIGLYTTANPANGSVRLSAFIKDLAENTILIIYFNEMAASRKLIEVYNDDALWILLIGWHSTKSGLLFYFKKIVRWKVITCDAILTSNVVGVLPGWKLPKLCAGRYLGLNPRPITWTRDLSLGHRGG